MSYFSTKLKSILERVAPRRADFAEKTGLDYSLLTNLVNDRRAPDTESLDKICDAIPSDLAGELLVALWCDTCPEKQRHLVQLLPSHAPAVEEPQTTYGAQEDLPEDLRRAFATLTRAAVKYPQWRSAVVAFAKAAAED